MFGGKFSFQRFSLQGKMEISTAIQAFFVENVHSMVSVGTDAITENNFREVMRLESIGTRAFLTTMVLEENINQKSQAVVNFRFAENFEENIFYDIYLASNFYLKYNFEEIINTNIFFGKDTPLIATFNEIIEAKSFLGKNIHSVLFLKEEVHSIIYVEILDKDTLIINVSIPPGAEIRIDSGNFTVTLNGVNIIHNYTGDWIQISRATTDLTITNGFRGTLLYQERFL